MLFSKEFKLTVVHDCTTTTINTKTIRAMTMIVDQTSDQQDITFTNTKAVASVDPNYCGSIAYTLDPHPFYLTIAGTILTLNHVTPSDVVAA